MFKKLFILTAMIMLFSFIGCSQENESAKSPKGPSDSDNVQFLEKETKDMVECEWFEWFSGYNTNRQPIVLKHSDKNAVFECTVDKGNFVFFNNHSYPDKFIKSLILKSGDGLPFSITTPDGKIPDFSGFPGFEEFGWWTDEDGFCWWPYEFSPIYGFWVRDDEIKQAFVEIILKIDNNIIGYTVIEIYSPDGYGIGFKARVLKSALFPEIDGKYQNVTKEHVKTIIEKIKNK